MGIVPGLCSVAFRGLGVSEVAELAASCGLEAIEWAGDVHVPNGDLEAASRAAKAASDHGISSVSYGSYLHAGPATPDEIKASVDTCRALGAPNLRVWTDWVGPDPDDFDRIAANLAEICESAEGLTVSVEFHRGTVTETAASTLRLLEAVDAPNLFTYWQPVEGLEVTEWLEELRAVREHLSHLHVFRWASSEERWPLADGTDLWPDALGLASEPGRWDGDRVAFIEFIRDDDPDQLRADAETLRGWVRR